MNLIIVSNDRVLMKVTTDKLSAHLHEFAKQVVLVGIEHNLTITLRLDRRLIYRISSQLETINFAEPSNIARCRTGHQRRF